MADAIESFVSTYRTYKKRRLDAMKDPTHANKLAHAKATFALSLARIRMLRRHDKQGYLFMMAKREMVSARDALITCLNYDPKVEQLFLDL